MPNSDTNSVKKSELITELKQKIKDYNTNPDIGIDKETVMAFIAKRKWKLNPNGHTQIIRDKIKTHHSDLIKIIQSQKTQLDVITNLAKIDKITKQILELGLDDTFNYDKEANDPDVGPIALKLLAQEIGLFLVVQGGTAALKHSKVLLMIEQLSRLEKSDTMKD